jgi:two-component system, NtrC family, sensor kinase
LSVGQFPTAQLELLKTFAEQAVIAITSAETYRALQGRTSDLQESLEYQTATSDVLQVINSSPVDLTPVFDAILDKAHGLCGATVGNLTIYKNGCFHTLATHGFPEPVVSLMRQPLPPLPLRKS